MSKVEPHGAEKLDLLTKRLAHEIQHGIKKKWSCPKVNLMFLFPVFKLVRHARNAGWIPHPAPKPRHPKQAPATFPRPPGLPKKKTAVRGTCLVDIVLSEETERSHLSKFQYYNKSARHQNNRFM
jgi:hypothetical protein